MSVIDDYRDLGNLSAVEPQYARAMFCDECMVRWTGCWDNFQCPQCGQGEIPTDAIYEHDKISESGICGKCHGPSIGKCEVPF